MEYILKVHGAILTTQLNFDYYVPPEDVALLLQGEKEVSAVPANNIVTSVKSSSFSF